MMSSNKHKYLEMLQKADQEEQFQVRPTPTIRLMAKFSEHYSPGIETGEGEGLSKVTVN